MKDPTTEPDLLHIMSENDTGSTAPKDSDSSAEDFDLRPPPPKPKPMTIESLSESLFSSGHLNLLLRDIQYLARFTSFLTKYRPQYHPVLLRYLETQKAIKAIEYANAVAEGVPLSPDDESDDVSIPRASVAATLDKDFEESSKAAFRLMVDSALPMYITYNLVKTVTECLINELTGRQTPLMRGLVGGLSEVFCLSDPKQEDNPIIYASEEFYRYTGYGSDDVIGQNCRFLQGPKTKRESVVRLSQAIGKGETICEALLNYRRDGRPFINLLLIAPLHDDKGNVKYFIGAQVDVTGLVARGKGLDGFEQYVLSGESRRRKEEARSRQVEPDNDLRKPRALEKLRELSEMFDLEESAIVRSHSRSGSASGDEDGRSSSRKSGRRVLQESDSSEEGDEDTAEDEDQTWKLAQSGRSGLSGKLPGVYESYLLVRPAPSLRIVFVSPKLRQRLGNVSQHPFLSHLAASNNTLGGLKESFDAGVPVSAKVNFLLEAGKQRDGTTASPGSKLEDAGHGRVCWISATPLVGGDDKVGVWMIVVVEKNKVPGNSKRETLVRSEQNQVRQETKAGQTSPNQKSKRASSQQQVQSPNPPKQNQDPDDNPIKPKRLEDGAEPSHDPPSQSTPPEATHVEHSERRGHHKQTTEHEKPTRWDGEEVGLSKHQDHHEHYPEHEKPVEKEGEKEVEDSENHNYHEQTPEHEKPIEKHGEEEVEGPEDEDQEDQSPEHEKPNEKDDEEGTEGSENQEQEEQSPQHEKPIEKDGEEQVGPIGNHDHHEHSPGHEKLFGQEDEEEAEASSNDSEGSSREIFSDTEENFVEIEKQVPAAEASSGSDVEDDGDEDLKGDAEGTSGTADVEHAKAPEGDHGQTAAREDLGSELESLKTKAVDINQMSEDLDEEDDPQNDLTNDNSPPGHEDTVVNHQLEDSSDDDDDTPSPTPPETDGKENVSGKNAHYMDYLRHPGSLPSGEYNRVVSGSFLPARYDSKGEVPDEDIDCGRSPYSVD